MGQLQHSDRGAVAARRAFPVGLRDDVQRWWPATHLGGRGRLLEEALATTRKSQATEGGGASWNLERHEAKTLPNVSSFLHVVPNKLRAFRIRMFPNLDQNTY